MVEKEHGGYRPLMTLNPLLNNSNKNSYDICCCVALDFLHQYSMSNNEDMVVGKGRERDREKRKMERNKEIDR